MSDDTREWFGEEILVEDVDEDERARRDREGRRLLLEQLDDTVVREYVETLENAPGG